MSLVHSLILDYLKKYESASFKTLHKFVEESTYIAHTESEIRNSIEDLINKGHPIWFVRGEYVYGRAVA